MEVLDRLIKFAMIRPRSEFEVKRWLVRKKVSDKDSDVALTELKKIELVNDIAFSNWWIEQRTTFRPKSRQMLVMELVKHGINKELARQVIESAGIPDDESLAFQLIERRKNTFDKLDKETRKKKITNLLLTRGFGWGVIKKVIKELN